MKKSKKNINKISQKIDIPQIINSFPTKNKEGFTHSEILQLINQYPQINTRKFFGAIECVTAQNIDGEIVIYHQDIELAFTCGIENRDINSFEFD